MLFKRKSKLFSSTEIGKKERRVAVGRNKNYRILTFFSVVNVNLLVTQLARLRCQVLASHSSRESVSFSESVSLLVLFRFHAFY